MPVRKFGMPGLGRRLRKARLNAGHTQTSAALEIGVSWMTVLRWEHESRVISEDKLTHLAELYSKPLRWFLTVEDIDLARTEMEVSARRISHLVPRASLDVQLSVEREMDAILRELEPS